MKICAYRGSPGTTMSWRIRHRKSFKLKQVGESNTRPRVSLRGILLFLGLTASCGFLFMYNIYAGTVVPETNSTNGPSSRSLNATKFDGFAGSWDIECTLKPPCVVTCTKGYTTNINRIIVETAAGCSPIQLRMYSCVFDEHKMPKMWMKSAVAVESLEILDCGIQQIENEAFNTAAFHGTTLLYLTNIQVTRLGAKTFLGLHSLKDLTLSIPSSELSLDNFLEPVQKTLGYFSFTFTSHKLSPEAIFGTTLMQNLNIVDLRGTIFDDTVNETSFDALAAVQSLYLANCQLTNLPDGSLSVIQRTVQLLDLTGNFITYLSGTVFESLLTSSNFAVQLADNRFHCNQKLIPFAESYEQHRSRFKGQLFCLTPHPLRGHELNSTAIKAFNEEPTTPPTTQSPPPENQMSSVTGRAVTFQCDTCTSLECELGPDNAKESVNVAGQSVSFTVEATSPQSIVIKILTTNFEGSIFWHATEGNVSSVEVSNSTASCLSQKSRSEFHIQGLAENKTYLFCLLGKATIFVSPFDCKSLRMPFLRDEEDMWITMHAKDILVTMLTLIAVFCMMLGGISTYCLIRYKPSLLRARKTEGEGCGETVKSKEITRTSTSSEDTANTVESCQSFTFHNPQIQRKISTISAGSGMTYVTPNTYEAVQYSSTYDEPPVGTPPDRSPPPLPRRTYTQNRSKMNQTLLKPRPESTA